MIVVEAREPNGNWYRFSSHGNESAAILYADSNKRSNPHRTYRVVGDDGSIRYIV